MLQSQAGGKSIGVAAHANATLITDRSRQRHIKCRGESVGSGSLARFRESSRCAFLELLKCLWPPGHSRHRCIIGNRHERWTVIHTRRSHPARSSTDDTLEDGRKEHVEDVAFVLEHDTRFRGFLPALLGGLRPSRGDSLGFPVVSPRHTNTSLVIAETTFAR